MATPEVQRLREVRMCNINSLTLTGAGAVHRFEHSVGTAHLASICADAWPGGLPLQDRRIMEAAALLHDVGSAAFGHSVEYVLDSRGFRHEALVEIVASGRTEDNTFSYRHASLGPLFFGARPALMQVLGSDLGPVGEAVAGHGPIGPVISGSIDLDNIDNVYRLAFHMGLVEPGDKPERLASAMHVRDGVLVIHHDALDLLDDWRVTRAHMYRYLLLNPDEFAAKCMLERALFSAVGDDPRAFRWHHVDYGLMERLAEVNATTRDIISRLMLGSLYGCLGLFETGDLHRAGEWTTLPTRSSIERELSDLVRKVGGRPFKSGTVAIHLIRDVNKTERHVECVTTDSRRVSFGRASRRWLIGVFLTNTTHDVNQIEVGALDRRGVTAALRTWLKEYFHGDVHELEPYGEAEDRAHRAGSGS